MCDPITAGLMAGQMFMAQQAQDAAYTQANQAAARANAQLQQEYAAAQAQTKANTLKPTDKWLTNNHAILTKSQTPSAQQTSR